MMLSFAVSESQKKQSAFIVIPSEAEQKARRSRGT